MIASLDSRALSQFGTIIVASVSATVRQSLRSHLTNAGGAVRCVDDLNAALRDLESSEVGLLILDTPCVDATTMKSIQTLRRRKSALKTMIVVVSETDNSSEQIAALRAGADEYIIKPFAVEVLLARVAALCRRFSAGSASAVEVDDDPETSLVFGEIVLIPHKYEVFVDSKPVVLTLTEFRLLQFLMSPPGRVRTRAEMQAFLGTTQLEALDRTVDSHVARMRCKLGRARRFIKTIRGVGYRLMQRNTPDNRDDVV